MTGRVVVAEDDAGLAYAIGRMLEGAGYKVALFTNAVQAWDDLKAPRRPRLLLTDIKFPIQQPDGLALARHATVYHRHLPVIYITAFAEMARLIHPERDGPVFMKPFEEAELMHWVGKMAPLGG